MSVGDYYPRGEGAAEAAAAAAADIYPRAIT